MDDVSDWTNPTIDGEAVLLRPFVEDDVEPAWEMINDPVGNDLTHTTEQFEFEQVRDWYLSRESAPDRIDLAVVERATGQFAGEVVLNEFDSNANTCAFRISLRGPDWYGRGLGSEATTLIVQYGLDRLGLNRITLDVLARNPRARRTYEKVGFVDTGQSIDDGEAWIHMAVDRPSGR